MLDNQESLIALYQLLSAMDPVTVNIQVHHNSVYITTYASLFFFFQAFFTALMKNKLLTSLASLTRWMGIVCTMMELMITLFPESTFLEGIG